MKFSMKKYGLLVLLAVLGIAGLKSAQAADPQVEATLSDDKVELGEQVELQIKITGANSVEPPEKVEIAGLTVGGVSQSTQQSVSIINGSFSSTKTTTFSFPIMPQKMGTFTIPPLTVGVNGKKITTRPLKLTVAGNGNPSNRGSSAAAAGSGNNPDEQESGTSDDIARAEIIIPKQSVYLGEAIPAEIRFYFNARVQVQIPQGARPQIQMDGFTTQKLSDPQERQIEKDGNNYNCLVFKTVIMPAKTGKLLAGPVEMPYDAIVSIKRKAPRSRTGGPFDQMFSDPFFNGMNMAERRRFMVRSNGVDLEVKPLPIAGKPKNFSGAVGNFKMETNASPLKVNIGDPLTLKMKISGRGNFDRVDAPQMQDDSGWRSYSPTSKFSQDDDAGISGTKTFEMALIPQEKKSALPVMEFSYFDPVAEKYVTLSSQPAAITVTGQNPPVVAQATATSTGTNPPPSPPAKQKTDDLFYISDTAHWGESFQPVYAKREFWLAQLAPALALLAFVGFKLNNKRKNNTQALRLAELQKEKNELLKTLNRSNTGYTDFFEAAVKYLQLETARTTGREPESISPGDAISSRPLDSASAEDLEWIFNTCAEQRYTGGASNTGNVPDGKRTKVLETIRKYENA